MVQRHLTLLFFSLSVSVFAGAIYFTQRDADTGRVDWNRLAMPGELSVAHTDLTRTCTACHDAGAGIDIAKCVGCHGSNQNLLARQPTAFHATIGSCTACHSEHQGKNANLRRMNHEVLARLGADVLPVVNDWIDACRMRLRQWPTPGFPPGKLRLTAPVAIQPRIAILDCSELIARRVTQPGSGRYRIFSILPYARRTVLSATRLHRVITWGILRWFQKQWLPRELP